MGKNHHEMYDGSGYPEGLKGEEIPLPSRILKVADVIDVLYSPRSYKTPVPVEKIVAELNRCKGKDFDPKVADIAIEVIKEKVVLPTDILRVSERRIFPAMLLLHFGEGKEVCCLNGYFYFDGTRGYFKLIEIVTNKLDLRNSVSAHLVIEVLSSIYEYNVHAIPLDETTWLISKIRTVEKNSCVCMLWNLEAFIITQEGRISVNIRKLSEEDLLFECNSMCEFDTSQLYKMEVLFENGEELILNGRIVCNYPVTKESSYYKYAFVMVSDTTKERLFKQIFRKHIDLKKRIEEVCTSR